VPRTAIAPLVGRIDETPIRLVPSRSEALTLLVTYARAIADDLPLATPELQRLAVTHMHDLIAATIGATRDGLAIAERRGIAAARLRSIMTEVSANLGDGDLSVAEVAKRQRVTPRYIHKLFENEGLTFSAFVLGSASRARTGSSATRAKHIATSVRWRLMWGLAIFPISIVHSDGAMRLRRPRFGSWR